MDNIFRLRDCVFQEISCKKNDKIFSDITDSEFDVINNIRVTANFSEHPVPEFDNNMARVDYHFLMKVNRSDTSDAEEEDRFVAEIFVKVRLVFEFDGDKVDFLKQNETAVREYMHGKGLEIAFPYWRAELSRLAALIDLPRLKTPPFPVIDTPSPE